MPSTELPKQGKNPVSAPKEPKHPRFNPCHPLKSLCKSILSVRCCIKGKNVRKVLACSILLLLLVNLALIIYLAVYHFRKKDTNLTSVAGALSYIAYNLDAHPILDIQVQDDDRTPCPQDYYSIILGTWPGTTPGCDCGWTLTSGYCDRSENSTEIYCDDVAPRKAIDMYDWGGSKWCVKKAKLGSQYNRTVECAEGFRKCSSGICVLEGLNCPVTKVKIQSTGAYKLETGTDRYVVTEIVEGETPVIDLDITPNDIPCFSADNFASGPVRSYVLIDQNEEGCGKYGLDDHSFKLDKMKQKMLFDQNDFPHKVYDLPDYASVYERTDSVLSYRRRLNVAESDFCLNIDTEILEKSSEAAKDLSRFMSGTLIAAIIIYAILFFAVSISACVVGKKSTCSDFLKGDDSKDWITPYLILGFIELIDLIVMFAATAHHRAKMMETQDYLMKVAEENCFLDFQAQSAVNDYQFVVNVVVGTLFKYSLTLLSLETFVVFACIYLLCKNRS